MKTFTLTCNAEVIPGIQLITLNKSTKGATVPPFAAVPIGYFVDREHPVNGAVKFVKVEGVTDVNSRLMDAQFRDHTFTLKNGKTVSRKTLVPVSSDQRTDAAIVYLQADNPITRCRFDNAKELKLTRILLEGRNVEALPEEQLQAVLREHHALRSCFPGVLVISEGEAYGYSYIDLKTRERHHVSFGLEDGEVKITADEVMLRRYKKYANYKEKHPEVAHHPDHPSFRSYQPRVSAFGEQLRQAVKASGKNSWDQRRRNALKHKRHDYDDE